MTSPDLNALRRWPNVPACYGWLSLDRRGQWRLRGETVSHRGLNDFLNQRYAYDAVGNHFVQNGPQRVYVELEYTPWIVHLSSAETLTTHVGSIVERLERVLIDDQGNLLFETDCGIALLCDRDLPFFIDRLHNESGEPASEQAVLAAIDHGTVDELHLEWQSRRLPLHAIRRQEVPRHYRFIPTPQPPDARS
ncbi:MAG TPA: DUF2946 family protein [Accumulibacter sp.]|nr:DUF2946 family protein [Accumulibacter sp.]HNL78373.1 DUF2946 family protein [Accumulibacter sp.]